MATKHYYLHRTSKGIIRLRRYLLSDYVLCGWTVKSGKRLLENVYIYTINE